MKRISNAFITRNCRPRRWSVVTRITVALLLAIVAQAIGGPAATAQEFRIYTRVSRSIDAGGNGQSEVLARTLTLFHAGKVYDYIQSVGEVTIFEPAHQRFTILSTTRSMATEASFGEIRKLLNRADKELRNYVAQPGNEGGPSPQVAKGLRFQLAPKFEETFNPKERSLSLSSPHVRYDVQGSQARSPEALTSYLRYADWTCRLNYVLHPQTLYPASRLKLNQSLREHTTIPTEVRLSIAGDIPLQLKAEHEIHWQLDSKDRSLIHHWETMLKQRKTRRVSFREYQKAMLVSLSKRRR